MNSYRFFGHYVVEDKLNSVEKARKTKPEKSLFSALFLKIEEITQDAIDVLTQINN